MEVRMIKIILVVVATAVPAFAAGIWTEATLVEHPRTETRVVSTPSTISPSEMHGKVKPDDLPVQYMQGDFN
jgi:hypothetical protein